MDPYQSPSICARCASPEVAAVWRVNVTQKQFNLWSFLITWFGIKRYQHTLNTFDVPVCEGCGNRLERIWKINRGITIFLAVLLGLLFGIVFLAMGFRGTPLLIALLLLVFVVGFGALIGAMGGIAFGLLIQEAMNYEFCNSDGQYYHFENKKFRREFAALNPSLIKPKKEK